MHFTFIALLFYTLSSAFTDCCNSRSVSTNSTAHKRTHDGNFRSFFFSSSLSTQSEKNSINLNFLQLHIRGLYTDGKMSLSLPSYWLLSSRLITISSIVLRVPSLNESFFTFCVCWFVVKRVRCCLLATALRLINTDRKKKINKNWRLIGCFPLTLVISAT